MRVANLFKLKKLLLSSRVRDSNKNEKLSFSQHGPGGQKGFVLVEAMIAILVLSLIVFSIMFAFSKVMGVQRLSNIFTTVGLDLKQQLAIVSPSAIEADCTEAGTTTTDTLQINEGLSFNKTTTCRLENVVVQVHNLAPVTIKAPRVDYEISNKEVSAIDYAVRN